MQQVPKHRLSGTRVFVLRAYGNESCTTHFSEDISNKKLPSSKAFDRTRFISRESRVEGRGVARSRKLQENPRRRIRAGRGGVRGGLFTAAETCHAALIGMDWVGVLSMHGISRVLWTGQETAWRSVYCMARFAAS